MYVHALYIYIFVYTASWDKSHIGSQLPGRFSLQGFASLQVRFVQLTSDKTLQGLAPLAPRPNSGPKRFKRAQETCCWGRHALQKVEGGLKPFQKLVAVSTTRHRPVAHELPSRIGVVGPH